MARPRRRARRRDSASDPSHRRLRLECLEDRLTLTTFTVTSLTDGPVDLGNSTVTLRDAIAAANSNVPAFRGGPAGEFDRNDVIQFQAGLTGTITLAEGQLGISSRLTINGPGSQLITISAGDTAARIFDVRELNPSTVAVAIRGLTITDGERLSPFSGEGGGIFNQENLTIENSIISGNQALNGGGVFNHALGTLTVRNSQINGNTVGTMTANSDGRGGGLFNAGQATLIDSHVRSNQAFSGTEGAIFNSGTLTLQNSLIAENLATFGVGGIRNTGNLTIRDSTIAGNAAFGSAGSFEHFGGLYNTQTGTATVQNTTISGNTATGLAAGVANGGTMLMENTTVSGNRASYFYGGVFNTGVLTLRNTTIAANRANLAGGSIQGAGIHNRGLFDVVLHNTIVVDNLLGPDGGTTVDNFAGDAASPTSTHNLIGPGDTSGLANGGVNGNQVGVVNALLGPLAGNGGLMLTHLPSPGSPALNAGGNSKVPLDAFDVDGDGNTAEPIPFDQRGSGFARINGGTVDIGAVEVQSDPALVGDYNGDGTVNAADYTIWRNTRGSTTNLAANGDASNNVIDTADYGVWKANFGDTLGGGASVEERGASAVDAAFAQFDGSRISSKPTRIGVFNQVPMEPDEDSLLLLATSLVESDRDVDEGASMIVYDEEDDSSDDGLVYDDSLTASLLYAALQEF